LKISTRKHEAELLVKNNGNDPDVTEENAAKSLGGVIVKTFQVCSFCGEEFCCGSSCGLFQYEDVKVILNQNSSIL